MTFNILSLLSHSNPIWIHSSISETEKCPMIGSSIIVNVNLLNLERDRSLSFLLQINLAYLLLNGILLTQIDECNIDKAQLISNVEELLLIIPED